MIPPPKGPPPSQSGNPHPAPQTLRGPGAGYARRPMSMLGNLLWIFLGGGLIIFLEYVAAGVSLCLTIIGIPFGIQAFKLAILGLVPFGKEVVDTEASEGALAVIMDLIWLVIGGVWIALTHLFFALLCAITIIGIPFAVQHMKLVKLSLLPFGKAIREV